MWRARSITSHPGTAGLHMWVQRVPVRCEGQLRSAERHTLVSTYYTIWMDVRPPRASAGWSVESEPVRRSQI